jgi:rhodanese-related sulfurtransferase
MINTLKKLFGMGPSVDFKELIAQGAVILDVRSPGEFSSGHARGAVNVPLDKLSTYIQKQKNKDQVIITCCASGMRSSNARNVLQSAGFANVYNGGPWSNVNF